MKENYEKSKWSGFPPIKNNLLDPYNSTKYETANDFGFNQENPTTSKCFLQNNRISEMDNFCQLVPSLSLSSRFLPNSSCNEDLKGYGNIAPKTNWGKLVTILYAIFGIPLMFLYLTNIGNILAKSFKFVYGRLCFRRKLGDHRRRRQQQLEQYQIHHIMLQDAASPNAGTNSIVDSSTLIRNKLNSDLVKDDLDDDGITTSYKSKPRVTVPITLCLLIIAGYICGGAALFSVWEGWDYLDGSYFCFVTLSTIGFGDLVPGDSVVSDDGTQEKLVICSLYLLTGMALIAMCFNLVQEEVVHKLRRAGRALGLLNDRDDSDD
ncbi:potassium channel subfamily K member 18-like [Argiope bruennichi]|nr:potassium channel subfamily K member 18-like [Argiope bruennichi]